MYQNNDHKHNNVSSKRRILFIKNYQRLIHELIYSYQ